MCAGSCQTVELDIFGINIEIQLAVLKKSLSSLRGVVASCREVGIFVFFKRDYSKCVRTISKDPISVVEAGPQSIEICSNRAGIICRWHKLWQVAHKSVQWLRNARLRMELKSLQLPWELGTRKVGHTRLPAWPR
jgi:hypothetical protein